MTTFRSRSYARRRFNAELPRSREIRSGRRGGVAGVLHCRGPLLLLLALLPFALGGQPAEAFRGWCMRDPVFQINGQIAHVLLAVDVAKLRTARALSPDEPIKIILTVPTGVDARFQGGDHGFGSGYDVQIKHAANLKPGLGGTPVQVAAFVPMNDPNVQVRVAFVPTMGGGPTPSSHAPHAPKSHGHRPPHANLVDGTASGTVNSWVTLSSTP